MIRVGVKIRCFLKIFHFKAPFAWLRKKIDAWAENPFYPAIFILSIISFDWKRWKYENEYRSNHEFSSESYVRRTAYATLHTPCSRNSFLRIFKTITSFIKWGCFERFKHFSFKILYKIFQRDMDFIIAFISNFLAEIISQQLRQLL